MKLSAKTLSILFPAVVLLLFLQFAFPREPYPAILMPGGGTIIEVDTDTLKFERYEVDLIHAGGDTSSISSSELIPFIPNAVMKREILKDKFGLGVIGLSPGRQLGIGPLSITVRKGKTTPDEAGKTRAWLRERSERITGKSAQRVVLKYVQYAKPLNQQDPIRLDVLRRKVVSLS